MDFYREMVRPDREYIVVPPEGALRFTMAGATSPEGTLNVVSTGTGGALPIRDFHIYGVSEDRGVPDTVSPEIAEHLHRSSFGDLRWGRDITDIDIRVAAEAFVDVKIEERYLAEASIVHPMGSADPVPAPGSPDLNKEIGPDAVYICVGETIRSAPFDSVEDAENSPLWRKLALCPEVIVEHEPIYTRKVSEIGVLKPGTPESEFK